MARSRRSVVTRRAAVGGWTRTARATLLALAVVGGASAHAEGAPTDAAASPAAPDATVASSTLRSILDAPIDENAYVGATKQCIDMRSIRGHRALDDRNIVFELQRGRYVLSQLRQRCEFLSQRDTIALESRGGGRQLCALDQVNVLEPDIGFGRIHGGDTIGNFRVMGRCFLGPFEEITKEQLAALRDAMKARKGDERGLWDWIVGD